MNLLKTLWRDEQGVEAVEVALGIAFVGLVLVGAYRSMGTTLSGVYTRVSNDVNTQITTTGP